MLNFLEQADKLRCQSKFKQAAKYYALAAEKNPGYESYYGLGDMLRMIGLYQKALQAYKKAKRFILKDALKSADIFMGKGMALRAVMEYKTAAACFLKAGEKYKLLKDPEGTAYSLWCLGGLCRIMGKPGEALKAFDQALALYKKSKNGEYVAFALCGRGGTLRILGRYKESLQCYKTANKYFTSQKDTFGRAYSNCGMGSANRMLGRYNISAALYKKAEKLFCARVNIKKQPGFA
jgi:tetratricopeptide (TPR) repeat protein